MTKSKYILYIVALIEGASVMATEISGAKLLAPYYGNSLYVWSCVMAVTLSGLALGYFFGGKQSKQPDGLNKLSFFLFLAGISILSLPHLTSIFNPIAKIFPLIPSVLISVSILLFFPIFLMGTTSPLLISLLTKTNNESGENSGIVYAISTIGGIIATFTTGFYLIPYCGIKTTLLIFSLLMMLISGLLFFNKRKNIIVFIFMLSSLFYLSFTLNIKKQHGNILLEDNGILGHLTVKEDSFANDSGIIIRKLIINSITQTEMNSKTQESVSEYIHLIERQLGLIKEKNKALVLGLGGGLVANTLIKNQFKVTGVEFDNRIIESAKKYFKLNKNVNVLCDDGRHFINNCRDSFNLIIVDVFKGEELPSHILTSESLEKLKSMLTKNGLILTNWHGYLNDETGEGTRCLLNTFKTAGYYYKICETSPFEDYRNLLIIASKEQINDTLENEIYVPENTGKYLNTDDKPMLEKLNSLANKKWRQNYLSNEILVN